MSQGLSSCTPRFENQHNLGPLPNGQNVFAASVLLKLNGKSLVRAVNGQTLAASRPNCPFAAIPASSQGGGSVDVIDNASDTLQDTNSFQSCVQSIPMPGVTVLADYIRQ
ncbi:MAG: hypothetical protein ACI8X5_003695 [Planctomycetota bacterium]|jgi:hypothetical protein